MLFLLPALYLFKKSKVPGKERLKEILEGHEKNCLVAFLMEPSVLRAIATFLREERLLRDTRGVTVEEKLGIFLFMLSHNTSYEDLQHEFKHSGETIHRHIQSVFSVIPALLYRFVKPTTGIETHWKISTDEKFFPYFQNCLGAIDGAHVPITISAEKQQAPYRNRKGTLSQNVMLVCDFDFNFMFISSGWEGSATDARVLRSALFGDFNVPEGKYYLVDGGYANTPSFIAPYRGEFGRGHQHPRNYEELFNHRHAILRNHIERAIGVLKKRFSILKVGTHHPIKDQVKIPAAAVLFHNLIRMHKGDESWLNHQPNNTFVDLPGGVSHYNNDVVSLSSQVDYGNSIRDMIALNMWNDYSHNQSRYIKHVWKRISKDQPVDRNRANWNAGLEKALVELLHEHNNECYRGQNGWSSESWNRIVKLFHENFSHNSFTKVQIQDKEQELKRDYKALKEARQQSGVSWDDRVCMIVAEEPIWANIIKSFPRTKKFRNKSFPLFEALGELYDGQTAEGTMNFTSTQPSQPHVTLPSQPPFTQPSATQLDPPIIQSDDDDLAILNPPATRSVSKRGKRARTNDGKADKRRQDGRVAVSEMMGRFLEMKEKQAEAEERARTNANENDFPVPMCIAVVDGMEDLSEDEKVDAFDIFKDAQNRAIFMTAKDSTRA
ncbi:hypothetical protein U9M48_020265 [Paspalum notatum var. saurae]|uniref:Myb/SANT-like domain-containing protein n=1 Tax=Paspalum notatum var. saurae TaxID=547442 RepID=A0AAQ3WRH9_PASNO